MAPNDSGFDNEPLTGDMRDQLKNLRHALLDLHKSILEVERNNYEKAHGKVDSPHAMLNLVMHDPWFGWFRPLSETVVQIDVVLESKDPVTISDGRSLLRDVRSLLTPAESGEEFAVRYHAILQVDPDIIMKHAEISKLLKDAN